MANSFIDPALVRMSLPEGPGWEWNPGQTFVTAFNNAQENKRLQQKRAEEAELASILLPYKKQVAALELEKLQQEVERSTLLTQKIREGNAGAHRGIMQGLQNPQNSQSVQEQNPYDIFNSVPDAQPTTDQETGQPEQESGGMDIMGYTASAKTGAKNPVIDLANSIADEDRPAIDTSKIPTTGLLADSSSGLTPTAMSAMRVATDAVAPEENTGSLSEADQMLLSRLSGSSGGVDFESLPSPEAMATPRIPIDGAAKEDSKVVSEKSDLDWRTLDPLLTKRKLLKSQYDGIQNIKNYRLDPIKLDQASKWNQATAKAIEKLSAFGITDPVTLDALTDLPSEQRVKAQRLVQESLANGGAPNWTSAIEQVAGGRKADGTTAPDRRTELVDQISKITDSTLDENVKRTMLSPLVDEFNTMTAQRPAFERFAEADSQLNMLPTYQAKGRPLNGRTDYDIVSQELLDAKLQSVQEMLKSNDPRVLNMTRYATTKDGTKLTASGFAEYQKDLSEKRNKFGDGFVIYTGSDAVFPTKGVETTQKQDPASQETESTQRVDGPESARSVAQTLRKIGQATGMEDPPHIYAKKMYERYVGKPFTDAAWPWVSTFLDELKSPSNAGSGR